MESLERILKELPFFAGLQPDYLTLITSCASNVRYDAGDYIFRAGEPAQKFYLVRHGQVAVELSSPARGTVAVDTLMEGDVLGYGWLYPPHIWSFDAHAVAMTRAIAIDAKCLLTKCESDARFGFEMLKRFSQVIIRRLQAAQLQLLDMYGKAS